MKIETIWMLEFFQEIKHINQKGPRVTAWRGPILRSRGENDPKKLAVTEGSKWRMKSKRLSCLICQWIKYMMKEAVVLVSNTVEASVIEESKYQLM